MKGQQKRKIEIGFCTPGKATQSRQKYLTTTVRKRNIVFENDWGKKCEKLVIRSAGALKIKNKIVCVSVR